MSKVEDCVSRKLSNGLSPGEKPTEQELAIKFSECREELMEASLNSVNFKLASLRVANVLAKKKR